MSFITIPGAPNAYISLLLSAALIYVPHTVKLVAAHRKLVAAKSAAKDKKGLPAGYDVRDPRSSVAAAVDASPEGRFISRADACHYNALENFPFICVAVLAAIQAGVSRVDVNSAAAAYVLTRIAYTAVFLGAGSSVAIGGMRSLIWAGSIAVCVKLLMAAAAHAA